MPTLSALLEPVRRTDESWTFEVTEDWLQGRAAFGGLLAAFAICAMRAEVEAELPLRSLQISFLGPAPPGEVTVRSAVLRRGGSVSFVDAQLSTDDGPVATVLGIFGAPRSSALQLDGPVADSTPAAPELQEIPLIPGLTPQFLEHLRLGWVGGGLPYTGSSEPSTELLLKLREHRVSGEIELAVLSDAPPTPGISMLSKPAPASSITWTLEYLGVVEPATTDGWWRFQSAAEWAADGYLTQTATLFAPDGRAVTRSHQLVAVYG